jgi:hypothetical protein
MQGYFGKWKQTYEELNRVKGEKRRAWPGGGIKYSRLINIYQADRLLMTHMKVALAVTLLTGNEKAEMKRNIQWPEWAALKHAAQALHDFHESEPSDARDQFIAENYYHSVQAFTDVVSAFVLSLKRDDRPPWVWNIASKLGECVEPVAIGEHRLNILIDSLDRDMSSQYFTQYFPEVYPNACTAPLDRYDLSEQTWQIKCAVLKEITAGYKDEDQKDVNRIIDWIMSDLSDSLGIESLIKCKRWSKFHWLFRHS